MNTTSSSTTSPEPELPTSPSFPSPAEPSKGADPQGGEDARQWKWVEGSPGLLAAALLFGTIFGFLLQKGGVAKFDILVGVLLLENFVVVKVMLSAIIVGMVGSYWLRKRGLIEQQIKETKLGANIIGGLMFGVGFGLLAYCPGTNAAAIGQGNLDALVGAVGLLAGSYAYALASKYKRGNSDSRGHLGKLTLPELAGVSPGLFVAVAAPLLTLVLVLLEAAGL